MNSKTSVVGSNAELAPCESSLNPAQWSMNEVTAAQASAALHRAHAMFNRVLAGWASDVLRLERQVRLGKAWPTGARSHRSAA